MIPDERAKNWERMRRGPEVSVPHEPDAPTWVRERMKTFCDRRITMTPEEKKEIAFRLGKEIIAFFKSVPVFTNQDTIEILGIATMYYHSIVYATGLPEIEEKP